MGLFGPSKKDKLIKQLQDAVSAQNAQIIQLQQYNQKLKSDYNYIESTMPKEQKDFEALKAQSDSKKAEISQLEKEASSAREKLASIHGETESAASSLNSIYTQVENKKSELYKISDQIRKASLLHSEYKAANKSYENNPDYHVPDVTVPQDLMPVVSVDLNCMNVKELRKLYNQHQKAIQKTFHRYEGKYTTKSNIAIYKLMVIAMEAELQNILLSLSYGKLEKSIDNVKSIINRYYTIAIEGNQSIAPSMKKFIAEIEYLFIETVKVEYEYYVKKERIKEEQRALREQMRQEAEERKALEAERKKIEKEESKYTNEIQQLTERMQNANEEQIQQLNERIQQLKEQLANVKKKKDDIITLQNGKAGYVYVISNLGSFGDNVFKVGMTRRLEPMDRVKELGDASVPFAFDVHSFIFSDDAVSLEKALHKELNDRRVNKVNLRKEFFRVSIDEIEDIVYKYNPSAEFRRTMLAEQYYQSQSVTETVQEIDFDNDCDDE